MSGLGTVYDNLIDGVQTHMRAMARLQEQMASGSKVNRASDSPTDALKIMDLQNQSRRLESYDTNLNLVMMNMEQCSSILQELSDSLVLVRQLLTQAASDTYTQDQRTAVAAQIDSILSQAVSLSNRNLFGQYLFGGTCTAAAPYVAETTDGVIMSVRYQGDSDAASVPVAPGIQQDATLVGEEVFRSDQRQHPVFLGNTGAQAGAGTSTVRGDVWLTVQHDTTTYAGTTGVAAGSSSAEGDTIVGTSHTLTIDSDSGRVRLDDGQFVAYGLGGDDSNIRLTNAAGDVVYVDVTGLDGGLSGQVDVAITATGKLSIDDLTSTVDLTTFTANEAVTDPATGRVLYVDTTQIQRTGIEPVHVPGTYDMFDVLIGIRDTLRNERGLTSSQQAQLLDEAIDSLDEVMGGITAKMASIGGRLQAIDSIKTSLEDMSANIDTRRAGIRDADVVQLATDLTRTQVYYQMILYATAKVLNLTLMDYI